MFSKNKKIESGARKLDKIVTGIIIGSAVASIIGLSQTKKGKDVSNNISDKLKPTINKTSKKALSIFGKIIAFLVGLFSKK